MVSQIGMLATMMSVGSKPADLAVIEGAPWIKKSLERPTAVAKQVHGNGSPDRRQPGAQAKGRSKAPTRATAGEGQMNHEATSMTAPTMKKATLLE